MSVVQQDVSEKGNAPRRDYLASRKHLASMANETSAPDLWVFLVAVYAAIGASAALTVDLIAQAAGASFVKVVAAGLSQELGFAYSALAAKGVFFGVVALAAVAVAIMRPRTIIAAAAAGFFFASIPAIFVG